MEDAGRRNHQVHGVVGPQVQRKEQRPGGLVCRADPRPTFMIQFRQPVQEREKPDLFVAQQAAQMYDPVEKIILDAGAAHQ